MKIKNLLLLGLFPLAAMTYGWYLGQLHQSMQDLAGILMFITGAVGLVIGLLLRYLLRNAAWVDLWWASILTGLAGMLLTFSALMVYARIHG